MERIPSPRDNADEVQPFTDEQVEALLTAARKGLHPLRDVAILNVLQDTGMRASELCGLRFSDWDITTRQFSIQEGKGKKARPAYMGKETTKALWKYVDLDGREADDPLFYSRAGEPMTYNALYHLFRRLGQASGVREAHPHRMRHTFAIQFLKNGGNAFTLQRLLGHTSLQVTNRYVQYAQADLQAQQ